MSDSRNVEWLNANANRAYPIKEDMTRAPTDMTGNLLSGVQLPNYVLVDFVLTLSGNTSVRVYLSQFTYVGGLVTFGFSDENGVQIALVSLNTGTHVKNTAYLLVGAGDTYGDALGKVVVGDLTDLARDLPEGAYAFTLATAEMETRCVRPALRGVRSLQINNQGSETDYLYGHIKLVSGTNIRLTYDATTNSIRIDAVGSQKLTDDCECDQALPLTNVVRTINGIAIEDVVIMGDGQCVDVTTDGDRVLIRDKCSEPCCDCPELTLLTNSLKILDGTVTNLEAYARALDERIRAFVTNYVLTMI